MATIRQKKLAKEIAKSFAAKETPPIGQMLENVGYSHSVAIGKPKEIVESEGVKQELFKLGFDSVNAKRVVGEILNDETVEPQHRLKAAELTFKVQGDMAPEKHIVVTKKLVQLDE